MIGTASDIAAQQVEEVETFYAALKTKFPHLSEEVLLNSAVQLLVGRNACLWLKPSN